MRTRPSGSPSSTAKTPGWPSATGFERRLDSRSLPAPVCGSLTGRIAQLEAEVERWNLHPGDLLIVDEAGMAGTFALDRLAAQARQAGAKLLLAGDWAQLAAVDAGGAFGMLVDDRHDRPGAVRGPTLRPGMGAAGQRRTAGRLPTGRGRLPGPRPGGRRRP